jgi:hypothetical protein
LILIASFTESVGGIIQRSPLSKSDMLCEELRFGFSLLQPGLWPGAQTGFLGRLEDLPCWNPQCLTDANENIHRRAIFIPLKHRDVFPRDFCAGRNLLLGQSCGISGVLKMTSKHP